MSRICDTSHPQFFGRLADMSPDPAADGDRDAWRYCFEPDPVWGTFPSAEQRRPGAYLRPRQIFYRHAIFDSIRKRVRTSNTADCANLFTEWIQQPTMANTGRSELQSRQGADLQAKAEHGPGHPPLPALLCPRTFHRGHPKRLSPSLLCPRLPALSLLDPSVAPKATRPATPLHSAGSKCRFEIQREH